MGAVRTILGQRFFLDFSGPLTALLVSKQIYQEPSYFSDFFVVEQLTEKSCFFNFSVVIYC